MTRQISRADLDLEARHRLATLAAPEKSVGLAAYRRFSDVLSADCDGFTEAVIEQEAQFVSNEPGRSADRHGWALTDVPPAADGVLAALSRRLPRLVTDLGVSLPAAVDGPPALELADVAVVAHRSSDFLGLHHDDGWPGPSNGRLLSFVYWFHRLPRSFDGGELRLSGWSRSAGGSFAPDGPVLELEPERDTLMVFPSSTRHEVRPVRCDPDNFGSARFALVGFVRAAR